VQNRKPELTDELFEDICREGFDLWTDFVARRGGLYHKLIPADHRAARGPLEQQRERAHSFVELGSGMGVITILADLMGYDAYGIEIDPELVDESCKLAERFGSRATFVEGSFVPLEYRDETELLDTDSLTLTEGADAYDELGMDFADFDLVFGFPWPGEEDWLFEMVRRHAGTQTTFLSFENREGYVLTPIDELRSQG
tara:strand:- start:2387 stop:2983 length:597 start_codon:yes stop_codon:yes gene_type:complete